LDFSGNVDEGEFFKWDDGGFYSEEETEGAEAEDGAGAHGGYVGCECAEIGTGLGRDVDV
jgi:hypothetical protein